MSSRDSQKTDKQPQVENQFPKPEVCNFYYWKNALTTTKAITVARVFFVITRQPLQLQRCSNSLRMRKVFLVLSKKHFLIQVRGSPGGGSQSGGVFGFLTKFDAPWTPIPRANILDQTCFGN